MRRSMRSVGFILVVLASLNVFGGYTVTERMLQMFRPKAPVAQDDGRREVTAVDTALANPVDLAYLVDRDPVHPRPALPEFAEDRAARATASARSAC